MEQLAPPPARAAGPVVQHPATPASTTAPSQRLAISAPTAAPIGGRGTAQPAPAPEPFQFTGTGSDYFRVWIVNVALTIVTLGVYSAWAKVRRLQYFYRNTCVAGGSFDYHGDARAIMKGRAIAFGILAIYNMTAEFSPVLALVIAIPIAMALPWLLRQSLRFRLHNSSWRGLRFSFRGGIGDAYMTFLLWPIASGLTLYGLAPLWHQRLKRYQHDNSVFGTTPFGFSASVSSFYAPYLKALLMLLGLIAAAALLAGGLNGLAKGDSNTAAVAIVLAAFAFGFLGFTIVIRPYLTARIQNLVWNHTTLGPHRFRSRLQARKLAWIVLSNMLLVIVTLGFFRPFAAVRLARYRVSCMMLLPAASLDAFIAGEQVDVAAMGEEMGESLDIDMAL